MVSLEFFIDIKSFR